MPGWNPMSFGNANDSKNGTGSWTPGQPGTSTPGRHTVPPDPRNNSGGGLFASGGPAKPSQADLDAARLSRHALGNEQARSNALMGRIGPGIAQTDQGSLLAARSQQEQALALMRQSAMGQGPSVAQAQMYSNLGNNIAAMNAASQGGGGPAQAMYGGANQMNNASMQGAGARAQEQAGLMSMYGQNAAGLNAADVTQYGSDLQQLGRAHDIANQQGIMNAQTNFGENQQQMQSDLAMQSYYQQANALQAKSDEQTRNDVLAGVGTAAAVAGSVAAVA